jgi:molecular chaperone GrpE
MSDPRDAGEAGQKQTPAAGAAGAPGPAGAGTGPQGGPGAAADPVALEARIRELEAQQSDLTDRLLRSHAEMDNLRKRTEREKADSAKYAITKFALDIVGISDNFARAVASVPAGAGEQDATLKALVEGVLMTERAFLQVLERHGVRRLDPKGEAFDPNLHQAVMQQDDPSVPANTVVQVFQPGYMIEDRVLRPAMVVVARGGAKAARPPEASENAPAGQQPPPVSGRDDQAGGPNGGNAGG